MKPYFDFGKDEEYLKGIKIIVDDSIKMPCYNPKDQTIKIKKDSPSNDVAHEQSHVIIV